MKFMIRAAFFGFLIFSTLAFSCDNEKPKTNNSSKPTNSATATKKVVQQYTFEIVNTYKHDSKAFTQGLVFHDGFLYESTGGSKARGDKFFSSLRKVEPETGNVLKKFDVADQYFAEGMTILNGKIYQLTWQENTAFVYDMDFKLLKEFRYNGEGWGLTNDGQNLIMSDGTHVIRVVNPETFESVRTLSVLQENGQPLMRINELEYVKGEIWANVWQEDVIVRIDPTNGSLLGVIDFSSLVNKEYAENDDNDVLNGIAYDSNSDRLFVTGKKWKRLYEVKIKAKE